MKHTIDPDTKRHIKMRLVDCAPELKPLLEEFIKKAINVLKTTYDNDGTYGNIEYLSADTTKYLLFNYDKQRGKNISIFQNFFEELESLLNETLEHPENAQNMFIKIQTITYCLGLNILYKTVSSHAQTEYVFGSEHLLSIVHRINHDYDELVNRGLLDELACSFPDDMFSLIWHFCLESKAPEDEKFNTFMSFLDGKIQLSTSEWHTYQMTPKENQASYNSAE